MINIRISYLEFYLPKSNGQSYKRRNARHPIFETYFDPRYMYIQLRNTHVHTLTDKGFDPISIRTIRTRRNPFTIIEYSFHLANIQNGHFV